MAVIHETADDHRVGEGITTFSKPGPASVAGGIEKVSCRLSSFWARH